MTENEYLYLLLGFLVGMWFSAYLGTKNLENENGGY